MENGRKSASALVVGKGAIGSALAAMGQKQGLSVAFLGRKGGESHRYLLRDGEGAERHCEFSAPEPKRIAEARILFVAVKAFDLEESLRCHVPRLSQGAVVIPLANGWTVPLIERFRDAHPDLVWRLGFATFGVSVPEAGVFKIASKGEGKIFFGPLEGDGEPTAAEALWLGKVSRLAWQPRIRQAVQKKWLFNTVINTLTAAHRLPRNGDLLSRMDEVEAVLSEAYRLGESRLGPFDASVAELLSEARRLIEDTADNENSMARDVRLGRRTESDYLAGLAMDAPEQYPRLAALHRQITGAHARE